jgi:hypothetical protein
LSTTNPAWTGLEFEQEPPVGLEDSIVPVLHRIPGYKNFGEMKSGSTYSGGDIQSLRFFIYQPGETYGAHLVEAGWLADPASISGEGTNSYPAQDWTMVVQPALS